MSTHTCEYILECPSCSSHEFKYDGDTDKFTCADCGEEISAKDAGKYLVSD